MDRKEKIQEIIKRLKRIYSIPRTALNFSNPFELLVATILSAQTTDAHVNRVTEKFFKKYTNIKEFADAPIKELEKDLRSINFYRNKAKNIKACAEMIIKKFNLEVPRTLDELITLPGVARKTANIVLSNAYNINEGIAVDTHVKRLSQRLGLTDNNDPKKIEMELMEITPREEWGNLSNLLIFHGRKVCKAKKPDHTLCVLYDICPSRDI